MQAVRLATAVEVVGCVAGAGERPLVFVAPLVGPHDKEAHRRLFGNAGVEALQPVVKPAQLDFVQLDQRIGTKVNGPGSA